MPMIIKPGVTAAGFRTAVKDYTEYAVVEELAARVLSRFGITTMLCQPGLRPSVDYRLQKIVVSRKRVANQRVSESVSL